MSQVLIKRYTLNLLKQHQTNSNLLNRVASSTLHYLTGKNAQVYDEINRNSSNSSINYKLSNNLNKYSDKIGFNKNNLILRNVELSTFYNQKSYFHNSRVLFEEDNRDPKNEDNKPNDPADNSNADPGNVHLPIPSLVALAPLQVPEFLPKVPLIAVSRNPLFPNFIKMLEVKSIEK